MEGGKGYSSFRYRRNSHTYALAKFIQDYLSKEPLTAFSLRSPQGFADFVCCFIDAVQESQSYEWVKFMDPVCIARISEMILKYYHEDKNPSNPLDPLDIN